MYGTNVSRETVSKITDAILGEMADWLDRPLEQVDAAVFIDAIVVKIRDGQVANRPAYTAIGVTADGTREILGIWIGTGGEGAKFWPQVLTELKNRGTSDVCIAVCDGLKGLSEAIETEKRVGHSNVLGVGQSISASRNAAAPAPSAATGR